MEPGHLTSGTNGMLSEQKKKKEECQLSVCFTLTSLQTVFNSDSSHHIFYFNHIEEGRFLHNLQYQVA